MSVTTTPLNQTKFYQCDRKVLFVSESEARHAAERIRAKSGVVMEPYNCPHCGGSGWHLRRKR